MKVQLVTREPKTGVFVISTPVELEEVGALMERVKTDMMAAVKEGMVDIVGSEGSLGRLFPVNESGVVVAMFLSQEEMRARRGQGGLAGLWGGGRARKPKTRRWR